MPLISFVGAAIDYTRANAARSSMQAALDSTALMLSKDLSDGTITTAHIKTKAPPISPRSIPTRTRIVGDGHRDLHAAEQLNRGSNIVVNGTGTITTDFMRVAGFPTIEFQHAARPRPGATSACASRWCSTTRVRWPTTARCPR